MINAHSSGHSPIFIGRISQLLERRDFQLKSLRVPPPYSALCCENASAINSGR